MKLTPVKVRGKRSQPKLAKKSKRTSSTEKEAPRGDDDDHSAPQAKRARIHLDNTNNDAAAAAAAAAAIMSRMRRKKTLPRLSQLPQEILERVFIASRNLALPLVNRELHHRLSSDSVRYQLVGAAFGPTWGAWYGLDNGEVQSYDEWMSDADRIAGDPAFQSDILACSWAELPMLLGSFNVWIRQYANGRPYFFFPTRQRSIGDDPADLAEEEDDYENAFFKAMESKFYYDIGFFSSISNRLLSRATLSAADWDGLAFDCRNLLGMHLEVNPGTLIPDDLLAGPFFSDDPDQGAVVHGEKFDRLFWLVRGGACLQEEQTWEVTREGLRAILDLVKEAARSEQDVDFRDAEDPSSSSTGELLKLAAGLFILFDVLGVFSTQWPRYILQTTVAELNSLPLPRGSAAQALTHNIAAALRYSMRHGGTARVYELTGCRWRRPSLRTRIKHDGETGEPLALGPQLRHDRKLAFYRVRLSRARYLDAGLQAVRGVVGLGAGEEEEERGGEDGEQTRNMTSPDDDDDAQPTKSYEAMYLAHLATVDLDSLRSPTEFGLPEWTAAFDLSNGQVGMTAHEPWSDFGVD